MPNPLHQHLIPWCLEISAPKPNPATKHSPLVAWAPDGYAIFGLYTDDGSKPTDLDACG